MDSSVTLATAAILAEATAESRPFDGTDGATEQAAVRLCECGLLEAQLLARVEMEGLASPVARYIAGGPWHALMDQELDRLVPTGWRLPNGEPKGWLSQRADVVAVRLTAEGIDYIDAVRRGRAEEWLDARPAVIEPYLRCDGVEQGPPTYLANWREILVALGMKDNQEDRQTVGRLNKSYAGPIATPGQGRQPFAEKTGLLEWWAGLDAKVQAEQDRNRDATASVSSGHPFGRGGQVVPDISGGVQKRRRDRQS